MAYIAIHYVNVNGKMYMPGEVIVQDMDAAQVKRLLEKGAIRKEIAPHVSPEAEDDGKSGARSKAPEVTARDTEDSAEDEAEPDAEEDAEDEECEIEADAEEEYEEAEPPEIDAADSIVEPAAEENKPARRRRGGKEKA